MAARVLIIEDNKANLELAEYLLKASGYMTLTARDGEEGVRGARKEHPDLIICDLQMPIMDGYQVVRELKKDPLLRSIPVVAVTALSMPGDRTNVLAAGFDGYLSKPIDPETFVRTVEGFLPPGLRARRPPGGS
jgi:CheY-like chemotaxis protein